MMGRSPEDAEQTMKAAGDALVILDDYRFRAPFAARLEHADCLWIDDGGFPESRPGHVLNHNLYATRALYPAMTPGRLLVGATYALLRDEFVRARDHDHQRAEGCPRLLITMGGSDLPNVTAKALTAAHAVGQEQPLEVRFLIGEMNPHHRSLLTMFRWAEPVVDSRQVAVDMEWADVAISAAGGTAMELCCVGVPAVVVAIAENQRPVAAALSARGLAASVGDHAAASPDAIASALREVLRAAEGMRVRQRAAIDGRGKDRVVEALGAGR
jgi:spore coat polysaccharide biosynthesis predicted glycosyltransferase SpsG